MGNRKKFEIPRDENYLAAPVRENPGAAGGDKDFHLPTIIYGPDGKTPIQRDNALSVYPMGNVVKDAFTGSEHVTKTFDSPMRGFVISNDGEENLFFTINNLEFEVKPREVFQSAFEPFTRVDIEPVQLTELMSQCKGDEEWYG
ncbi:hypothetical protein [Thalassobacillus sp. C254]|uniref:hypothetical protein n=1 Tax=Thalassobacillus sp. C254 TaxID=1225341 RepID=UPI0006D00889|nr:hypothetical protein [Thalassobacillus sp. C254]